MSIFSNLKEEDKMILVELIKQNMPTQDIPFNDVNLTPNQKTQFLRAVRDSRINASGVGSGTTNIAANFTPTKVPIALSTFANGIIYDSTNTRYKIAEPGQYLVIGFLYYSNPSEISKSYQTMVYKNGAVAFTGYQAVETGGIAISTAAIQILDLVTGDYLELYGQTGSTSTQPVTGSLSYLSIARV